MANVRLHDVSVTFPVPTPKARSLRAHLLYLGSAGTLERDARGVVTVSALRNVSFEARKGDRVALVGRNGSGKTTLLKVIARIYAPSSGSIEVEGRVSPVLGGGLGVDEELAGYEAIEYALLLRGVAPRRIPALREEIADFTELRGYLDVPVRTYSAGMKTRLGFAVATADEPDALLIDEGIMAGDIYFMQKARGRANRMLQSSNLLFLASHSEDMLQSTCNKAILLDRGEIVAAGTVEEVLHLYHRIEEPARAAARVTAAARTAPDASGERVLSSAADAKHPAELALDGAVRTHWLSAPGAPVRDTAYLGYDFGEGREVEVCGVTLQQWCGDLEGGTCVTAVALQCSNDGFGEDVRTADTFRLEPTVVRQSFGVATLERGRFWRLIAKSEPGSGDGWGIIDFDLDTVPPEDWKGGRAIGSAPAAPNTPVDAAFDDNPFTHWTSLERQDAIQGRSWIGWDFGPGRNVEVRSFMLRQWDGGGLPNTISAAIVQSSDDGFLNDIRTAGAVPLAQDSELHTYGVAASRRARFWRILADSATGGGRWGVLELRFSEQPAPDIPAPAKAAAAG